MCRDKLCIGQSYPRYTYCIYHARHRCVPALLNCGDKLIRRFIFKAFKAQQRFTLIRKAVHIGKFMYKPGGYQLLYCGLR